MSRIAQPLPVPPTDEYDSVHELTMRRQIEQNFEDVLVDADKDKKFENAVASLAMRRYDFMFMASGVAGDDAVVRRQFRTVTSTGSALAGDDVILVDATSGAVTLTLPPAAAAQEMGIKKIDVSGNAVTVDGDSAETIDGSTTVVLPSQYDAIRIASDGTTWWIL